MKGYMYSINKEFFNLVFINDTGEKHNWYEDKWSHYIILHRVLNFMKSRGFEVGRDLEVGKCVRKNYWYGKKGDLEFKAGRYPRGFSIEFFQNINFENKNGGYYDFNKFEMATYLVRLMYLNETKKIENFIKKIVIDVKCATEKEYKLAVDKIKNRYVESLHHIQEDMNFDLKSLDRTTCESYNNTDRDGKTIFNGDIKYFRDRGRLKRGKVYHNINNMWWVILNDTEYTNIADFNLFDAKEEDFKIRRKVEDRKPKTYVEKMKNIKSYSSKELIKELRNRGFKKI
ncbi:hypothetical protein SIK45_00345 [Clostridioides difficile]|uniref:hypothetical protein n=1 Tax=Clostridioides difficile TaxID=1496 RepID=UPI0029C23402|nr:hypothetical protein [Clostridioides difficile]MDX5677688.1 hypothetical protein [Clostridioides difficile]